MLKLLRALPLLGFLLLAAMRAGATGPENLSVLGQPSDWGQLEKYQETITHDDFVRLLQTVYCPRGVTPDLISVGPGSARILADRTADIYWTLRFAQDENSRRGLVRTWVPASGLPKQKAAAPLSDLRIAIDPGHIGGSWSKMEERWFQIGDTKPVEEGNMTLQVAQMLGERLLALGAKVTLVRDKLEPVTTQRPADFRPLALDILHKAGIANPREDFTGPADPLREQTVRWQSELLFYRNSEIRRRAEIVNKRLRPDLVLCLHFNAEAWGDPKNPTLVDANHLHLLVNGSYSQPELELDDERFEMLYRLLTRCYNEELNIADRVAATMAKATGLPPYQYKTENVVKVGTTGYVYARNLMANRLYACPVIYLEPYVMNSHDGFARIQAGDYDGVRNVNGVERPSIYHEYVDSVVEGLLAYYQPWRP